MARRHSAESPALPQAPSAQLALLPSTAAAPVPATDPRLTATAAAAAATTAAAAAAATAAAAAAATADTGGSAARAGSPLPADDAAVLWAALHLPALVLESRLRPATDLPLAVLEPVGGVQRVVAVDAQARARGVQPGMGLAAALALCPELEARARDAHREQQLLRRAAALALRYSPRVSLEPPDGLLLEVRGSLALFGGAARLGERLVADCAARGLTAQLAMAPTPLAALALARTGQPLLLTGSGHFIGALSPLPLAALRWPPRALERLATMGVRTLGGALRLPRAGFARRFGRESLESLDRLTGRSAEPRRAFIARERFAARCEPAWELATHEAILRHLGPLLAELESFLRSRQAAVNGLEVRLHHRRCHEPGAPGLTRCTLRLAAPELLAERFAALLGEQLARTVLPAPVIRCELRAGELLPFAAASESLWRPGEQGGAAGRESPAFIERLRARLGADAVYGLCLVPEHRPEQAWRIAEPVLRPAGAAPVMESGRYLRRPLWLLRRPEPLGAGPQALRLVTGPERIETGWWDGDDVARDYYVALDQDGAELWVFRERPAPHGWYLHGVFA